MRLALGDWLPPALLRTARRIRHGRLAEFRVAGSYPSWEEAAEHASGYDSEVILERVRAAALRVKRGEAKFERDGVCFQREEFRWEVLACLMLGAAAAGGRLNLLDFGGALGGFYVQHKRILAALPALRWGVVEQPQYVECGRAEFADARLAFHASVEECARAMPIDVALLSGSLQYLEKPWDVLARIAQARPSYIVLDRTTFREGTQDVVVVQVVPETVFPAKLPMWVFSEQSFEPRVRALGYAPVACFSCPERSPGIAFKGIFYRLVGPVHELPAV